MSIRKNNPESLNHRFNLRKEAGPHWILSCFFAHFKRSDVYPSCLTCLKWDEKAEMCKKFSLRPPATVIVNSCEHYEDEAEIPF